jgi:hypothetical protein
MSDYTDILRACAEADLRAGRSGILNMTSNSIAPSSATLTIEALESIQRAMRDIPPRPAIDLYGHALGTDQCFTIDVPEELRPFSLSGRQLVIVPETRIDEIYRELRAAGVDVRLKPRMSACAVCEETPCMCLVRAENGE